MKNLRFWAAALLLACTALLLHTRSHVDKNPPSQPLSEFPASVGAWNGSDLRIEQETRDALGNGDFLSRNYFQGPQTAPINLFIGYFPTQ